MKLKDIISEIEYMYDGELITESISSLKSIFKGEHDEKEKIEHIDALDKLYSSTHGDAAVLMSGLIRGFSSSLLNKERGSIIFKIDSEIKRVSSSAKQIASELTDTFKYLGSLLEKINALAISALVKTLSSDENTILKPIADTINLGLRKPIILKAPVKVKNQNDKYRSRYA